MEPTIHFPLTLNEKFALKKGGFILSGTATLVAGTVTVEDRRIQPSSIAVVAYTTTSNALSDPGVLSSESAAGELTINSEDASDASDVSYIVIL